MSDEIILGNESNLSSASKSPSEALTKSEFNSNNTNRNNLVLNKITIANLDNTYANVYGINLQDPNGGGPTVGIDTGKPTSPTQAQNTTTPYHITMQLLCDKSNNPDCYGPEDITINHACITQEPLRTCNNSFDFCNTDVICNTAICTVDGMKCILSDNVKCEGTGTDMSEGFLGTCADTTSKIPLYCQSALVKCIEPPKTIFNCVDRNDTNSQIYYNCVAGGW